MAHIQQVATVYRRARPVARRRSHPKTAKTGRTGLYGGNDFLRHSFLPLMAADKELTANIAGKEQSFFSSLSNLAALYRFEPLDVSRHVYPLNIYLSHQHARQIVRQGNDVDLLILETDGQAACLATVKTYDTRNTLYYLPIQALFHLQKAKVKKQRVLLLLSVCAYLYHKVGVPYYRDNSSYLHYQYEMMKEMTIEDKASHSKSEMKKMLSEFAACARQGNRIRQLLNQPEHLRDFHQRLASFQMHCELDIELHRVASNAFCLYENYPDNNLMANIPEGFDDNDEDGRIRMEQYVSFIWNTEGWIYDTLAEYVNSDLQEYTAIDEPTVIQYFDKPQDSIRLDLSFEEKLFTLMDDFAYLLNRIV